MTTRIAIISCAIASLVCAASPVSFQTHYISLGTQDTSVTIVTDAASNVFIVSRIYTGGSRVTKTDPSGNVVAVMNLGQVLGATGAAVDTQGNLFVVGNGLVKLDNGLANILATSSMEGAAVATDQSGNVYIAGAIGPSLPAEPGYIRVAELSPDLSTILHTGLFGSPEADCNPIYDDCRTPYGLGIAADTTATAIAIDPSGAVVVAGYTDGIPAPLDQVPYDYAFVVKFSADLSSITAEKSYNPLGSIASQTYFTAVALDAQGNVLVVGYAYGAITIPGGTLQSSTLDGGGLVMKYDSGLKNLIWGTFLGAGTGVAVDSQGNVWIGGLAELTPDGTAILNSVSSSQFYGKAISIAPNSTVAVLGSTDSFLLTGPPDQPSLLMVASSANNQSSGTIAPIELISLFGTGIGPDSPLSGVVVDGAFANSLGGYQVLFNGVPAPLIYAGPNQINVVSPAAISGQQTVDIEVVGPAGTTAFPTVFVAGARPQIFSQQLQYVLPFTLNAMGTDTFAIAYNQDGTLNSQTNPAPKGSTVTIWATGTGLAGDPLPDGSVAATGSTVNLPVVVAGAQALYGAQILYAGQAPSAVQGLTQINFQISPSALVFGPSRYALFVQLGASTSGSAEIWITVN